jgi:hypothetical protein
MIVYVLFVHKKLKILKKSKEPIFSVFLGGFLGFFGWVFYCQPCDKASIPRIDGHSDTVTDFAFSPQTVKLWRIPASGPYSNITRPELVLPEQPRKVNSFKKSVASPVRVAPKYCS